MPQAGTQPNHKLRHLRNCCQHGIGVSPIQHNARVEVGTMQEQSPNMLQFTGGEARSGADGGHQARPG